MPHYAEVSWERMIRAVERVRDRLRRAVRALEDCGVPYAVAGCHAVAAWVSRIDEAAVRNTQDVDLLLRRGDLDAARDALGRAGFVYRHVRGIDLFLDGPDAKVRDAIHIVFAGELLRPNEPAPAPDVEEAEVTSEFRLVSLDALIRMKLTAFRDKDRVHLRDMLDIGLIDESWIPRLPVALAKRLREIIATPDG